MSANVIAMPRREARPLTAPPVRVLLADGEWLVRAGLRAILDADDAIEVVAVAADRDTAVLHAARHEPDVIVLATGLRALGPIAGVAGRARVILVTESDADEHIHRALRAGAAGVVSRSADPACLAQAVKTVAAGSVFVPPRVARQMLERAGGPEHRPDPVLRRRFAHLSERELDVVRLLARGMSNADIASELFLSEGTVKTYVTRTLNKLGLKSRVQVVVAAYDAGLVRPRSVETPAPAQAPAAVATR